ncbi:Putative odorant receptor [Apis cerana cerana]|uniref:Odorant receptor n=1 Tax=Apis cerana cerana TaxID=94128 RepID=A0A2A3E7F7_APICC|nr:Putative odorant receptor [Apis cerana cerana]
MYKKYIDNWWYDQIINPYVYPHECIFSMCNMLSIAAPLLKLITLVVHREDFFYLILYLQRKFLHGDYNDYERNIVLNCKRKCMFFTCSLTFTTLATVVSYVINPLVDSIDKEKQEKKEKLIVDSCYFATKYYAIFKKCIRQHQALIAYCRKLEEVFNLIVLEQVLMFSMLICLDGYLVLMANTSTTTRLIFGLHITVCLCQLLMFTYSCDCIIRESLSVATAANRGPWPMIPMTTSGRMMKKDLILVIMRSGIPCCLTGKGFFVVSLETYTSEREEILLIKVERVSHLLQVLSTAASYFTLLKQHSEAHS